MKKIGIKRQVAGDKWQSAGFRIQVSGFFALTSVLCLLTSGAVAAEAGNGVDGVRAALEKWVETRKVISQEQRDWALGKEMLNERIDLVQQEIGSLKAKMADAQESISDADKKRAGLVEENDKLKEASVALNDTVLTFEQNTLKLLTRLPDPIRERLCRTNARKNLKSHLRIEKIVIGIRVENGG